MSLNLSLYFHGNVNYIYRNVFDNVRETLILTKNDRSNFTISFYTNMRIYTFKILNQASPGEEASTGAVRWGRTRWCVLTLTELKTVCKIKTIKVDGSINPYHPCYFSISSTVAPKTKRMRRKNRILRNNNKIKQKYFQALPNIEYWQEFCCTLRIMG